VRNENTLTIATMHWRRKKGENGDEEWGQVGGREVGRWIWEGR